jgi:hypothetical protein
MKDSIYCIVLALIVYVMSYIGLITAFDIHISYNYGVAPNYFEGIGFTMLLCSMIGAFCIANGLVVYSIVKHKKYLILPRHHLKTSRPTARYYRI